MPDTRKIHYAWIICLGGTLMLFASIGLGINVFSAFQPHLLAQGGLSNTQGSFLITVRSFFVLLGMTSANALASRLGLRRSCTLAMFLLSLSSFLFGAASRFPLYCLAAALVGLGYSWAGMIPASLLMARWFQDRQSLALGLASAGTGLATILAPVPFTFLIERFSLRLSFWTEGALILLLALLFWLLVRDTPAQKGLSPYRTALHADRPPMPRPAPKGLTPLRWCFVLTASFCVGAATSLGISNFGVLYSTAGYEADTVARLISVMGLCMMVGKVACGQVTDRLGGRISNYILYVLVLVGFALCCLADLGNVPLAYLAMVLSGLGLPLSAVSPPIWARDLCGDGDYAKGLKWIQSVYALGIFLMGTVPGALADRTGSYVPAYSLFWGMLLISLILLGRVYEVTGAGRPPEESVTPTPPTAR